MPTSTPTGTPTETPTEVFHRFAAAISSGAWDRLSAFYAEDAVVELPFALPTPGRLEGRATLHERFTGLGAGSLDLTVENIRVHRTADPEVIIAEFDYRGHAVRTGRDFVVANIQVLRIRDGLIVATRDFHDHAAITIATEGNPALAAALPDLALTRTPVPAA